MKKGTSRGWFGVVLGLGGAFAIVAYNDDNPVFAAVLAVATVVAAVVTYLFVDRVPRRDGSV